MMDDERWENKPPKLFPWAGMRAMDRDSITVVSSASNAAAEPLATHLVGRVQSYYLAAMSSSGPA